MAELNFNLTPVKSENHCHNRSLKRWFELIQVDPRGSTRKQLFISSPIGENQSRYAPTISPIPHPFTDPPIHRSIHPSIIDCPDCNEPPKASIPASIFDERMTPGECETINAWISIPGWIPAAFDESSKWIVLHKTALHRKNSIKCPFDMRCLQGSLLSSRRH